MKLRNIFLAGLAVCTMASCSKDDDINKGPAQPVDALVSFGITTDAMTKAAGVEDGTQLGVGNENFVETLTALIFDANGKLVGRKDTVRQDEKAPSIDRIEHVTIKVTPGDGNEGASNETFQAVLIANAKTEVANVTKLSDLEDGTAALGLVDYEDNRLPMASKTLSFTNIKPLGDDHTENWIYQEGSGIGVVNDGGEIKSSMVITLYRLVARIDLEKVTLHENTDFDFTLTRVFLANVASKSPVKYLTDEINPLAEGEDVGNLWKGFQSDSFKIKDPNLIIPANIDYSNIKDFLQKEWENGFNKDQLKQSVQFNGLTEQGFQERLYFYIFAKPYGGADPGNLYDTRLVLEGLFKRTPTSEPELRHFHVVLNKGGENGVMANYIYKLAVTITGEGSPNENEILLNAHISSQIEVEDWNVIEQKEEDTN